MVFFYSILAVIFGLLVGSFANVCIHRIPRGESIVTPRSHCPQCQVMIRWYDNIPLVSYLLLRGRCRQCHGIILWQYPLVEGLCGFLSWFVFVQFPSPYEYFVYSLLFVTPLVILSVIDLRHMILPDVIILPGIFVGCAVHVFFFSPPVTKALVDSLIGILVGGGILLLMGYLYEKMRHQEGMGGGDIKLAAMIGAFLGWKLSLFVIFVSSFLGVVGGLLVLIVTRQGRQARIPYGPFLALAGLLALFYGNSLMTAYLHWTQRLYFN